MDSIAVTDLVFGVVTTLILGTLTVIEFRAARKRKLFEDSQYALDILASTSTLEILELLAKPSLSAQERDFLTLTFRIAKTRLDATKASRELWEPLHASVEQSLQRLFDVIGDDPEVQQLQSEINSRHGMQVQTDRSRYSWGGEGRHPKYEVLHLIAQRFIEKNGITSRADFDEKFGAVVRAAVGEVNAKRFSSEKLLDPIALEGRFAARDAKLVKKYGSIAFDGVDYRAGWSLGYGSVPNTGRAIQLPVIEYFRKQPGYDIAPA